MFMGCFYIGDSAKELKAGQLGHSISGNGIQLRTQQHNVQFFIGCKAAE
jgi:hypothetical protein